MRHESPSWASRFTPDGRARLTAACGHEVVNQSAGNGSSGQAGRLSLAAFGDVRLTFIADVCLALGAAPSSADFIDSVSSGSKIDAIVLMTVSSRTAPLGDAAMKCACPFATNDTKTNSIWG